MPQIFQKETEKTCQDIFPDFSNSTKRKERRVTSTSSPLFPHGTCTHGTYCCGGLYGHMWHIRYDHRGLTCYPCVYPDIRDTANGPKMHFKLYSSKDLLILRKMCVLLHTCISWITELRCLATCSSSLFSSSRFLILLTSIVGSAEAPF